MRFSNFFSTFPFMVALLILLISYPLAGGVFIHKVSHLSLFDSVYYCCITILTVGFGDIDPPIPVPYLILFIVVGVTLVTISGTKMFHDRRPWRLLTKCK
ncbi:Ion channel [Oesophagostomum dentatum]|uniref:Ion channel n=1 Tax=Oesophagostomum dentatum TaxID=61180 RepID=A0A0B1SDR4_OESDE|nr:Ion channel [Oesophagostomum dentatum]